MADMYGQYPITTFTFEGYSFFGVVNPYEFGKATIIYTLHGNPWVGVPCNVVELNSKKFFSSLLFNGERNTNSIIIHHSKPIGQFEAWAQLNSSVQGLGVLLGYFGSMKEAVSAIGSYIDAFVPHDGFVCHMGHINYYFDDLPYSRYFSCDVLGVGLAPCCQNLDYSPIVRLLGGQ